MLKKENTILLILDFQGKLAEIVFDSAEVMKNACIIIDGFKALGLPILWLEQYPEGLGPTIPQIASHLTEFKPLSKRDFSAVKNQLILKTINALDRKQILIMGIETHVCIYQTSSDLLSMGYEVHVVKDAVSSRTEFNKNIGIAKIERAGGHVTSVETALLELVGTSESEDFKKILKIIK
jgi:hypothetical protein